MSEYKPNLKFHKTKKVAKLTDVMKQVKKHVNSKYQDEFNSFMKKIINEIIYNEKAHIVARFKDYLILDDTSEFLKRFYRYNECVTRLPKIYEFYETYSKIFPNYIILPESKCIYNNIKRKQKLIDNNQKYDFEMKQKKKGKISKLEDDRIFNTDVYESLMNETSLYANVNEDSMIVNDMGYDKTFSKLVLDSSVNSIEKLIDNLNKEEKMTTAGAMSIRADMSSNNYHSRVPVNEPVKASDSNNKSQRLKVNSFYNYDKLTIESCKEIMSDRKGAENELFQQKLKDNTKNSAKMSDEMTYLGELKQKIKETPQKNSYNSTNLKSTLLITKDNKRRSSSKLISENQINEKNIESARVNPSKTMHKYTSSMPKTTGNNIFYIFNQNPLINTQINIYGKMDDDTAQNGTPLLNTLRENSNSKQGIKLSENTGLKQNTLRLFDKLNLVNKKNNIVKKTIKNFIKTKNFEDTIGVTKRTISPTKQSTNSQNNLLKSTPCMSARHSSNTPLAYRKTINVEDKMTIDTTRTNEKKLFTQKKVNASKLSSPITSPAINSLDKNKALLHKHSGSMKVGEYKLGQISNLNQIIKRDLSRKNTPTKTNLDSGVKGPLSKFVNIQLGNLGKNTIETVRGNQEPLATSRIKSSVMKGIAIKNFNDMIKGTISSAANSDTQRMILKKMK